MSAPSVRADRGARAGKGSGDKPESEILFQSYFKSVGPRTYAAQVKKAGNGNHFLVLTEGKRDDKTDEVRKTRLYVFSEDFSAFFRLLQETAQFIRAHPVPDEVKKKRDRFWKRQNGAAAGEGRGDSRSDKRSNDTPRGRAPALAASAIS